MTPSDTIARKRDGLPLTDEQISSFVDGFCKGTVAEYQMSAMAMAIYLRGLNEDETISLTRAMLNSGVILERPASAIFVDKHSTGGVGDKVSIVLAPLLACCDVCVPMISGRGLGPTGGTLDKLESIRGFRTDLSIAEIQHVADHVGCVITGATDDIAPADRRLYALRDVTATVSSIPLITASILSKKLAENLNALVLDVKCGSGAFMKSLDDARKLAAAIVRTGASLGVEVTAIVSDMNQPLGRMIGNAVEVDESVRTLEGNGPADLLELTLELGTELLLASGRSDNAARATEMLREHIDSGRGLEKLRHMCRAQGADLDAPRPVAPMSVCCSERAGFVQSIDVEALGRSIIQLGGGRKVVTDRVDPSAGLEMLVRIGDRVQPKQSVINVFARPTDANAIRKQLVDAITVGEQRPEAPPLIAERVGA